MPEQTAVDTRATAILDRCQILTEAAQRLGAELPPMYGKDLIGLANDPGYAQFVHWAFTFNAYAKHERDCTVYVTFRQPGLTPHVSIAWPSMTHSLASATVALAVYHRAMEFIAIASSVLS